MGLSINQNIAAINSYRNLSNTQNDMSKSLEKLSSGFRINRAADDAAGLAISEGLRSQVGGLKVAARNAQDGISVVQTAEGALTETHAILQRLRDLSVQGANDSNNEDARGNIKVEADSLVKELDRIAQSTNFNGTKLLNGDVNATGGTTLTFQVGADGNSDSAITVDLEKANVASIAEALTGTADPTAPAVAATWNGNAAEIATAFNVDLDALVGHTFDPTDSDDLDALQTEIAGQTGNTGATVAYDATDGYTVTADGAALTLAGAGGTYTAGSAAGAATGGFDVSSHDAAQATINLIDKQIKAVSTARAELGAYQNRFEHTIKNINVAVENLSASESRIRDTDMADEMMNFTKNQILSQAGTAMLAQANQLPQGVLQLLR